MTKNIKRINWSVKWSNFWLKGLMAMPLAILLQAKDCNARGKQNIHQYKERIEDSKDISKPIGRGDKLYEAVEDGGHAEIKVVLERYNRDKQDCTKHSSKDFPNAINQDSKRTPLGRAVEKGELSTVKLLCAHPDIDPNKAGNGETALVLAIKKREKEIALYLLNHYTNNKKLAITQADALGDTPLHLVIKYNKYTYTKLTKSLIEKISKDYSVDKLCTKDRKERSPLHIAARYNNYEAFKQLWAQIGQSKELFDEDHSKKSIFAHAYLPRHYGEKALQAMHLPDGDSKIFEQILTLVAKDLTAEQWQSIESEINRLSNQLNQSYVDKLHKLVTKYNPLSHNS